MHHSDSIKEIASALAEAQAEFPAIPRDRTVTVRTKTGGSYKFSYAPLDTILSKIKPTLRKNGLAFLQSVNGEALTTTLMHKSGEWITSDPLPIKVMEAGSQALGSAITYAKRYALSAMLGIATEEDDDGAAADGHESTPVDKGITPNTGAGDSLTNKQKSIIADTAALIKDKLEEGKEYDAYGLATSISTAGEELENEKKLYLWSLLNSKERAAIKRQQEAERKADGQSQV